jgi:hypothetical protein
MAGSSKITADSILAGFPLAKLSTVAIKGISKPNRQKLTILNRELNACAITIHSYHENGALSHLVLPCVAVEFSTMNGAIPFITPINPGHGLIIPPGQTERQISVLEVAHTNALNDFLTYNSAGLALKKLQSGTPQLQNGHYKVTSSKPRREPRKRSRERQVSFKEVNISLFELHSPQGESNHSDLDSISLQIDESRFQKQEKERLMLIQPYIYCAQPD